MTTKRAIAVEQVQYSEAPGPDVDSLITDPAYELWPAQRGALRAIIDAPYPRGALLPLAVGGGKFLASVLAPTLLRAQRPVLLVPAHLYLQTMEELKLWRKRAKILPQLKVLKYSTLSRKDSAHALEDAEPDVIVCDECHYLKNSTARVTRVVSRYLNSKPETRMIMLSGTIAHTSIADFAHLAVAALREGSPVPSLPAHIGAWDAVVAPKAEPEGSYFDTLLPLLKEPVRSFKSDVLKEQLQQAVWSHIHGARGVHAHSEPSCSAELIITPRAYPVPDTVSDALKQLNDLWQDPAGREIDNPADVAMQRRALAQGFFFEEVWPGGTVNVPFLEARRAWGAYVRAMINKHTIDTELDLFEMDKLPARAQQLWTAFDSCPGPRPERIPVFIDTFFTDYIQALIALEDMPALIWVDFRAVQDQIPGCIKARAPLPKDKGTRSMALSMRGFGTGHNLQAWHHNIVCTTPPNASAFEQLLGRTHRGGQTSNIVTVDLLYPEKFKWVLDNAIKAIKIQASFTDTNKTARISRAIWRQA